MEDLINFKIISSENGDGWKQTEDNIHMVGSSIYVRIAGKATSHDIDVTRYDTINY